jgi:hypothetical protein
LDKTTIHNITDFANELKVFNRNDVLVNIHSSLKIDGLAEGQILTLPENLELNKIYKTSRQQFKENGSTIFCLSSGIVIWEWKGKTCESPIMLCPGRIEFNKIKREYTVSFDPNDSFINPFLLVEFQNLYDYTWPKLDFMVSDWTKLNQELSILGFNLKIKNEYHLGNFHHHRFAILRDVEFLEKSTEFSEPLRELFLQKTETTRSNVVLTEKLLFPSDKDQTQVFSRSEEKNLVVQGPPGTGKSQVLTNFIGKTLYGQHATLVVSEKRVALEVLQKKLTPLGLQKFCFLPSDDKNSQSLLDQLKETWLFLESCDLNTPFQLHLSKQKIDALQFKLDLLSKKDIVGGVSFDRFQSLSSKYDLGTVSYNSQTSLLSSFSIFQHEISGIYASKLHTFIKYLPYRNLSEEIIISYDQNLKNLEQKYNYINKTYSFDTKEELFQLMKKASFAQLISNEQQKVYFSVLKPNSAERKKFNRLSKRFYSLRKQKEILSNEKKNWKIQPTKTETENLLQSLQNPSFLKKIRLTRRLKSLLESSFIPSEQALENWLKYLNAKRKFEIVEKQLLELGITNENELDWIKSITQKINEDDWENYSQNKSRENNQLANLNPEISAFYQDVKLLLQMTEDDSFSHVFSLAKIHFQQTISKREILRSFPEKLFLQIGQNTSLEALEKEILKSNWINFIGQFPAFENFDWNDFPTDLNEIIQLQDQESLDFSKEIIAKIKSEFDALFTLLNTSNRKLTEEQKLRKTRLKKGRSLLVKEFAKSRSHPTIRELLSSEASEWIKVLLPIWMANPAQVADFFPLEREQFEYVLFDEATQIPLVHSLGALYRGKRTLVVGDEQQMTPTHFFKTGESEPIDLLHQARFTWEKIMLKHHYRSQNPELISFSNKHFYDNELIAYPNAHSINNPINLHFINEARYIHRENEQEAKKVAETIEKHLNEQLSLGIVAFSETQLACIYRHLSTSAQQILDERIEQNTCFFRALENIQGDECDHLIISLGYGPNEDGKLLLNFGPLNRKSGRRRLNVLFSRAKMKIDFFTSIHSGELVLSANDSLNLLRQFLQELEIVKEKKPVPFPYQLKVSVFDTDDKNKRVVKIQDLMSKLNDANEIITLHRVLSERDWLVHYA